MPWFEIHSLSFATFLLAGLTFSEAVSVMPHQEEESSEEEEENQLIVPQPEAQGGAKAPTDRVSEAAQVQEAEEQPGASGCMPEKTELQEAELDFIQPVQRRKSKRFEQRKYEKPVRAGAGHVSTTPGLGEPAVLMNSRLCIRPGPGIHR